MTNSSDDFDLDLPPPESSSEEFDLDLPPPEPSLVLNLLKKNIGEVKQKKIAPEPEQKKEPEIQSEKQEVQPPHEVEAKKPPPKKRIGFLRLTLDFVGLVILLIAAAGILVELYLPREKLRVLAQQQLTKTLNIPVSIGRLNFSFLRGLELSQFNVGKGGNFFYAKSVVLDYDLTKLLQGKFILNEAAIDYPDIKLISQNGIWNFQPLLELGKTPKKQAPPSKGSSGLPPIPIAAVLNELRIKNLRLLLNQDNDLVARLNGLSVKATGNFNLDKIRADLSVSIDAPKDQPNLEFSQFSSETEVKTNLSTAFTLSAKNLWQFVLGGRLNISDNSIKVKKTLPAPNLEMDFRASVNLRNESAQLEHFLLQIGNNNQIEMNAIVARFNTNPIFQTVLSSANIDLSEITNIIKPLKIIPAIDLQGKFGVKDLKVIGELSNKQLKTAEIPSGVISLKNVALSYPQMEANVENFSANANLSNIRLENLIPQSTKANINFKLTSANFKNFRAENLNQSLEIIATQPGLTNNEAVFKTSLKSAEINHPEFGIIKTDFSANGSAKGNFAKGNFESLKFQFASGPLEKLTLKGKVLEFGKKSFRLSQFSKINLNQVKSFLPKAIWKKIGFSKLDGTVKETLKVEGNLNQEFFPQKTNASLDIEVDKVDVTVPNASINNLNLKTALKVSLTNDQKVTIAPITLDLNLDKALVPDLAVVGPIKTKSIIKVGKSIPITGDYGMVPLNYESNIGLESAELLNPNASLSDLKLTTNVKADLYPKEQNARNISISGMINATQIAALNQIQANGFNVKFSADVGDKTLENTQTTVTAKILSPSYKMDKDFFIALEEVQLKAKSRQNLKKGDVVIETAQLSLPSLLEIGAQGNLNDWGKSFDLKVRMPKADLGSIWQKAPESVKTQAQNLTVQGIASLNIEAKGNAPTPSDLKKFNLPLQLSGRFGIQNATVSLPKLSAKNLNASTRINYKNKQGQVAIKVAIDEFKNQDIQTSGKATLNFDLDGDIPTPEAAKNLEIPLKLGAKVSVENVSVEMPQKDIKIEGLNHNLNANFENGNAKILGKISIAKLLKKDVFGDQTLNPEFQFNYLLQNWNQLSFLEQSFKIPAVGVQASATGKVEGFKQFLNKSIEPTLDNLIKTIDASVKVNAGLNASSVPPLIKEIKTTGGLNFNFQLNQNAGKQIEVGGNLGFDRFNLFMAPNLEIQEVNGKVIFSKKLLLNKSDFTLIQRPSITAAQKGYFSNLREFSPFKDIFTIQSLRFDKYRAKNIGVDLFYKDNQLRVEKFLLDVLSGGVAGNLFLKQTPQGPALKFFTEFAELSFEDLTGQKLNAPKAQTEIDGSVGLGLKINNESETVGIEEIEAKIAITRIGEEALDRILLFLDPEESKPAIVSTRSKLKLATPHQLFLVLENGNLSVDIQLKDKILGNIIQAPGLKRISVSSLKQFKQINEALNKLAQLKNVLQYVAAQGVYFDSEGKVKLF
jgi:hypothetical protein